LTVSTLVSIAVVCAAVPLVRLVGSVRHTTLVSAARWAWVAAGVWAITWYLEQFQFLTSSLREHLWYASAVLALCPAITVLGSRRPGTRVWTWFITIPMILALTWPVLTLWLQGSDLRGLHLETPQLVGYGLVLIMGTGNYIGTRYTLPAFLYAGGNALIVFSSSQVWPRSGWGRDEAQVGATGLVAAAVLLAAFLGRRRAPAADRFDRLWADFFDQFGIVWGRRIQDRINHVAAHENWPVRLGLTGFVDVPGSIDRATAEIRMEHTVRWLLRRFVDPSWIDDRLGNRELPPGPGIGADS